MKIFITGGTGFIGSSVSNRLAYLGHEVTILTRDARKRRKFPDTISFIEGNPAERGNWTKYVKENEVIINLAGASIFRRWNKRNKRIIWDSRIESTKNIVGSLSERKGEGTLLLNASAVGYYGFHGDKVIDEDSKPDNDFLFSVAEEWEKQALFAEKYGIRVVLCRFGIVLGRHGGALSKMLPAFKLNFGSPLGDGSQWFSWIHEKDLFNIILYLIDRKDISGPVNFTSPYPVTNKEFTISLAKTLKRLIFLPPAPAFMLRLILGEMGSVILGSQKVVPKKLLDKGFDFHFPELNSALEDILKK